MKTKLFLMALLVIALTHSTPTFSNDTLSDTLTTTLSQSPDSQVQLTQEQQFELQKMRLENERYQQRTIADQLENILIPVIAITLAFGVPGTILILWIVMWNRRSRKKLALIEKALDKGIALPENFFSQPKEQTDNKLSLSQWIMIIAGGGTGLVGAILIETLILGGRIHSGGWFRFGATLLMAGVALFYMKKNNLLKSNSQKLNEQ